MTTHVIKLEVSDNTGNQVNPRDIARIILEQMNDLKGFEVSKAQYETAEGGHSVDWQTSGAFTGPLWTWPSRTAATRFRDDLVNARLNAGMSYEDLSYYSGYSPSTLRRYEDSYGFPACPRNFLCLELPLGLAPNTLFQHLGFTLSNIGLKNAMRAWQDKLKYTRVSRARTTGITRTRTRHYY